MYANHAAAPPIAVEGKGGGIPVEAQTQMRTIPLGSTDQGGPLFVASVRALL
jgi:hypothetical protein